MKQSTYNHRYINFCNICVDCCIIFCLEQVHNGVKYLHAMKPNNLNTTELNHVSSINLINMICLPE